MKMNQNIAQKITLNTSVAPAVQQALKVLQMGNMELQEHIEQQSLENPFLKVNEPPTESLGNLYKERGYQYDSDDSNSGRGPLWEKTLSQSPNFQQVVLSQINMTFSDSEELYLARLMFSLLDANCFFTYDIQLLAKKLGYSVVTIKKVLSRLKCLEPVGVFAYSWKESVLLQLADQERETSIYEQVLESFEEIAQGEQLKVCNKLGISEKELYLALKRIKNIQPYPLRGFQDDTPVKVRVPEVILERDAIQGWVVSLNADTLPKALVDREYFYRVKSECSTDNEKNFVRNAFHQASWLISAMDQRCQNILKISQIIVQRQAGFFDSGAKSLLPMTLKDVAVDASIHESTVSRAISNKYIQTPQGVFAIKYFFTQSIQGSFQAYSAESIRKQIRQMVESEDSVLSDEKIAMTLNHLGVDIARRTVTKYRENMSIPSSTERRRIKKIKLAQ